MSLHLHRPQAITTNSINSKTFDFYPIRSELGDGGASLPMPAARFPSAAFMFMESSARLLRAFQRGATGA